MGKLLAFFFFIMWTIQLISRATNAFMQWQSKKNGNLKEESWEIIEPSNRDDGTPIQSTLSQIEKARKIFGESNFNNSKENNNQDINVLKLGTKVLIGVTVIALLITIPILIVALT
tara:strand:- start:3686 stop:4033 length:348 start_codon:yes stop_codon:yes gene_type:complete